MDKHTQAFLKDWRRAGNVAELVDRWPRSTEPWAGPPAPHDIGMSVHACNASIQDTEARGSEAQARPWLPSKFEASLRHMRP